VQALRRLEAGLFSIEQAKTIEQLTAMNEQDLLQCLINVDKPLEALPAVELSAEQAVLIKYGQSINLPALSSSSHRTMQGAVRMYQATVFLGLGEMLMDGKLAPKKLFNMNNE
jgi:tRNA pseudouridine55 synthase